MSKTEKYKYDDIINLPHHVSSRHPQMPMMNRAAQFSPFAALTGYDDAVRETARLTDEKIELDEYEKEELDRKIQWIGSHLDEHIPVSITYFQPDDKKAGGAYEEIVDTVRKISVYEHEILLSGGTRIPIHDIISLEFVVDFDRTEGIQ